MRDYETDPTYRQLLAAVLEAPAEDTPRLVLADRLEELGAVTRAKFIRHQIADGRPFRLKGGPVWHGVTHRGVMPGSTALARELLPPPPPTPAGQPSSSASFVRGFVVKVSVPAEWWLAHGDALLAGNPVQWLVLTTYPEAGVVAARAQRAWKQPPEWGVSVLRSWRAEWPGVSIELARNVRPATQPLAEAVAERLLRAGEAPVVPVGDRVEWVRPHGWSPAGVARAYVFDHLCPATFGRREPYPVMDVEVTRVQCTPVQIAQGGQRHHLYVGRCPGCRTSYAGPAGPATGWVPGLEIFASG